MDDVLKRIIEIEDKAQNIVEDVKKESAEFDEFIDRAILDMQQDIEKKANNEIDCIKKIEAEFMEDETNKIKEINDENLKRINKIYEENKEKWVLDAFNMIIEERS